MYTVNVLAQLLHGRNGTRYIVVEHTDQSVSAQVPVQRPDTMKPRGAKFTKGMPICSTVEEQ